MTDGERRVRGAMLIRRLPLTDVPTSVLYVLSIGVFLLVLGLGITVGLNRYKQAARLYRLTGRPWPITTLLRTCLSNGALLCANLWFFWWYLFGTVWFWFGLASGLAFGLMTMAVYLGKVVTGPGVTPLPEAFRLAPEAVRRPDFAVAGAILNPIHLACLFALIRYPSSTPIVILIFLGCSCFHIYYIFRIDRIETAIAAREVAAEVAVMQWQSQSEQDRPRSDFPVAASNA